MSNRRMNRRNQDTVRGIDERRGAVASLRDRVRTLRQAAKDSLGQMAEERRSTARSQRAELSRARLDLAKAEKTRRNDTNAWRKALVRGRGVVISPKRGAAVVPQLEKDRPLASGEVSPTEATRPGHGIAEPSDLHERVVRYLAARPEGTRLVALEREFGLSRIQMARVVRRLIDEKRLKKRDLLYFSA